MRSKLVLVAIRNMTSWAMLAFSCFFLLSCVSTMGCVGCDSSNVKLQKPWNLKPQESFGLMMISIEMTPDSCMWVQPSKKPCDIKEFNLPTKIAKSVGSSIVVGHSKDRNLTYLMTAAHVCHEKSRNEFSIKHSSGKDARIGVAQNVSEITVSDYHGNTRQGKLYRLDVPNDLCLVTTPGIWGNAFSVSSEDPEVGEKVYNVAAPHKIWAPGMVLMMDGYYSGRSPSGMYHYTIPARPGSSGSPILNREGKIVGVIQRAVMNFENLGISTSTQAIREILSTIPKDEPKIMNPTRIEVFKL